VLQLALLQFQARCRVVIHNQLPVARCMSTGLHAHCDMQPPRPEGSPRPSMVTTAGGLWWHCGTERNVDSAHQSSVFHVLFGGPYAVAPEASPGQNGRAADAADGGLFGEYAHVLDAKDLQVLML
jgi:hypothetical protein